MIYIFGNSHANFFNGLQPGYEGEHISKKYHTLSIRPMSVMDLKKHYPRLIEFIKSSDKTRDYILITIGEHDCRMYLAQLIEQTSYVGYKNVIENYTEDFISILLDLKNKGYKIIVWGGHPSTNLIISKYWSEYMKTLAIKFKLPYISLIEDLVDKESNILNLNYYLDSVHLNSATYLPIVENKLKQFRR